MDKKNAIFYLGGYEHFKNEAQNKTTGYGIGCEFKYYLLKTLYAVGNFHTGINSEFLPRTAIAEVGEIDFSMRWKTYEYKGGIGIGNDLYCKKPTRYMYKVHLDYQRQNNQYPK